MDGKKLSRQLKEASEKMTQEKKMEADKTVQMLEEKGFFLLCGCSVGEKNHTTPGQKRD